MFFRIHFVKQLKNLLFRVLRGYRHIGQQRHIGLPNQVIETHVLIINLHQQVFRPGGVVDPQHEFFFFEVRVRTPIFTSFRLFRRLT